MSDLPLRRRAAAPFRATGPGRIAGWAALVAGVPLVTVTLLGSAEVSILTVATVYAILALAVGFLIKQGGMLSFGHACWFGLGAYVCAVGPEATGLSQELFVVAAPVAIGIVAFLVGLVIVRLPGFAFSMVTLAVGQAVFEAATKTRTIINGSDGFVFRLPKTLFLLDRDYYQQPESMFVICWLVLVVIALLLALLGRSRFGLLTEAIRENEERTRFLGFETLVPRASLYAVSAAVGGVAGVLFVLYSGFASPEILHWSVSGSALIMALIGGTGRLWGPIVGAITYFMLRDLLVSSTEHWMIVMGFALIGVTVLWPSGMAGALTLLTARGTRER
jgi:branched-chain amino acid transport system permease protein